MLNITGFSICFSSPLYNVYDPTHPERVKSITLTGGCGYMGDQTNDRVDAEKALGCFQNIQSCQAEKEEKRYKEVSG